MLDPGFWSDAGYTLAGLSDPEAHPTIAQKLVSDLLLYGEQPSLRRALRERILAAQVTAEYGRSQVLEWVLNSADYGNDAYGVEAAAQLYFGVPAAELTPGEAAVLAATSQAPGLNPLDAPELAAQRGRKAIELMQQFGTISADAAKQALSEKPSAISSRPAATAQSGSEISDRAFLSLVLRQLDTQYTAERIRRGGLAIITTLDYALQQQASSLEPRSRLQRTGDRCRAGLHELPGHRPAVGADPGGGRRDAARAGDRPDVAPRPGHATDAVRLPDRVHARLRPRLAGVGHPALRLSGSACSPPSTTARCACASRWQTTTWEPRRASRRRWERTPSVGRSCPSGWAARAALQTANRRRARECRCERRDSG